MPIAAEVAAVVELGAADEGAAAAARSRILAALPLCHVSAPGATAPAEVTGDVRPPAAERWYVTARAKLHVPAHVTLAQAGMWFHARLGGSAQTPGAPPDVHVMTVRVRPAAPDGPSLQRDSAGNDTYAVTLFVRGSLQRVDVSALRSSLQAGSSLTITHDQALGRTGEVIAYQARGSMTTAMGGAGYVTASMLAALRASGVEPRLPEHPYVEVALTSEVRLSGEVPPDAAAGRAVRHDPGVGADRDVVGGRALLHAAGYPTSAWRAR